MIQTFEGCRLSIYNDVSNHPTIGIGHLIKPNEHFTTITLQQAQDLLVNDLQSTLQAINRLITISLNSNQLSALLSFTFNLGAGTLQRSTLRQKLNHNEFDEAAKQFPKYCFAGGRKIEGLISRRLAEQKLFLSQ